ncbi:MAG TPA: arylsulfatase [Acidimicrobiales bacterium]
MRTRPVPTGRRMSETQPSFVPYPRPPSGAPNVLMIVLDDIGFAQLGCFGSPILTPHVDRLASEGLRYNRFHVTSICSSTRAALLTGRNHHAVGVGMTMETPLGYPGYTGRIPASAATLARVLRDNGYSTIAVGKWHLCPRGEYSASGPMTRWPLGMGFERYYGFLGAETNQWAPELCRDNTLVDPPRAPDDGYHLSEDLVDEAIRMILDQRQATPAKPFFCYLAFGAAHAPHQVPPQWSDSYRGLFDGGWEAVRFDIFERQKREGVVPSDTRLTARPPWIPDWGQLAAEERRLFSRYMEVFAGFVTHADAQIGRLLASLRDIETLDQTLVMVLSDNGASAEGSQTGTLNEPAAWLGQPETVAEALGRIEEIGGHRAFNHYPFGWAWAGNTPLQLWKRYAWLGGVRTPLIVRWPDRVTEPGGVRPQFCHAIDLYPTVLEAAGLEAPEHVDGVVQQRIDGASIGETFSDPAAPDPRTTQYFEMHGSRGIYHRGWKATTDYVSPMFNERAHIEGSHDFDDDHWALFNLDEDFAEAIDLSAEHPAKVEELKDIWWAEAGRNQVLPLYEGPQSLSAVHPSEFLQPQEAVYRPGTGPVYEGVMPSLVGGFSVVATVELDPGEIVDGVLCAFGDLNEGWALYLLEGKPLTTMVSFGHTTRLASDAVVPVGLRTISVEFRAATPGEHNLSLLVDGEPVASGHHPGPAVFPAVSTAGGGMLVGRDRGLPVSDDYRPPFPFRGRLHEVRVRSGRSGTRRDPQEAIRTATAAD